MNHSGSRSRRRRNSQDCSLHSLPNRLSDSFSAFATFSLSFLFGIKRLNRSILRSNYRLYCRSFLSINSVGSDESIGSKGLKEMIVRFPSKSVIRTRISHQLNECEKVSSYRHNNCFGFLSCKDFNPYICLLRFFRHFIEWKTLVRKSKLVICVIPTYYN